MLWQQILAIFDFLKPKFSSAARAFVAKTVPLSLQRQCALDEQEYTGRVNEQDLLTLVGVSFGSVGVRAAQADVVVGETSRSFARAAAVVDFLLEYSSEVFGFAQFEGLLGCPGVTEWNFDFGAPPAGVETRITRYVPGPWPRESRAKVNGEPHLSSMPEFNTCINLEIEGEGIEINQGIYLEVTVQVETPGAISCRSNACPPIWKLLEVMAK